MIDQVHDLAQARTKAETSTATCRHAPSTSSARRRDDALSADDSREVLALISRVRACDPDLFSDESALHQCANSDTPAMIGRFEIVRELGRGGFGVVLLARDPNLDRLVALKVPHPDVVLSADLSERFLREGKAAAALAHPNIVSVYEAATVGPISYLVSAYCEGPSLAAWLCEQTAPVEPRLAAELIRDMALAVQHAHERGIIHRDLKPGNVLLEQEPADVPGSSRLKPLITDFGMARVLDDISDPTLTGSALGTPAYMSPEQAAGQSHAVNRTTDVYALGVILYELLTGVRPFEGETTLATLHEIREAPLTSPAELVAAIPNELDANCVKCLSRDPRKRHETAGALAADLEAFLSHEQLAAGPHSTLATVALSTRRPRRRPLRAALLGLAAVGLLAFLPLQRGITPRQDDPAEPPATEPVTSPSPRIADTASEDLNRRVTHWVLEHGGHVFGGRWILGFEDIPEEQFTVTMVCVSRVDSIDDARFQDLLALDECVSYTFALAPLNDAQLRQLARPGITMLELYATAVTDEGLRHVSRFPDLTRLQVRGRTHTDELLRAASRWPELTSLTMMHTQVTSDGLTGVSEMSTLRELSLNGSTGVDDAGLRWLARLDRLRALDLRGTGVTDAGVYHLKSRLPACAINWDSSDRNVQAAFHVLNAGGQLRLVTDGPSTPAVSPADFPAEPFTVREIDLRNSARVTREALESIRQLRELDTLGLSTIDHVDSNYAFLAEVASLKQLVLHGVAVDPAAVAELSRLDQLEILEFRGGQVTEEQQAALRERLPRCQVIVTPAS